MNGSGNILRGPGREWLWWLVSLLAAVAAMAVTAAALYMPLGKGTAVLGVGVVVYVVVLLRDPKYWRRRMAGGLLGMLAATLAIPNLTVFGQLQPGTLGGFLLEGPSSAVSISLSLAIVAIVVVDAWVEVTGARIARGGGAKQGSVTREPKLDQSTHVTVTNPVNSPTTADSHDVGRDSIGRDRVEGGVVGRDHLEGGIHNTYIIEQAVFPNQGPGLPGQPEPVGLRFEVPAPTEDFTGRQEQVEEILDYIRTHEGGAAISCVHGAGGVGKTAVALVVADRLRRECPDGQLFLNLHGLQDQADREPLSPPIAMLEILRKLDPQYPTVEDPDRLAADYRAKLTGQRLLLLLDNALDDKQVAPLKAPPPCLTLVTSRRKFSVSGLLSINLNVLEPDRARELLLRIEPRIAEHADRIAGLCGRMPLALCAAAHLLHATQDLTPEEYVKQLADERHRLDAIGAEGVERGVEASLMLSYRRLPPDTASVFRQLAVFAPGASFLAAAVEAVCEDPEHRHLSELVRYSLVEYDAKTARYRLHDLVRLFATRRLDDPAHAPERLPTEQRHAEHFCDVLSTAGGLFLEGGEKCVQGLAVFDRERANIIAGQSWAARNAEGHPPATHLTARYPDVGAYVLDLRLHAKERITWLQAAVAAARVVEDRHGEGIALGNLGNAYAGLGDVRRAIEYYEQRLVIAREIGDRRGEGNALGNLGVAYANLGDVRRAIEHYEQALAISREIGDRRGEGADLGNLGNAYAVLDDVRRAIGYYEQALVIDREIGNRHGEGADLGNLGLTYAALGDVGRAIEYYEQQLVIARELGDRRGEGADLGNLGLAYADLGDVRRAIEYYEQALVIYREIGDRRGEGNALFNRAVALDALGRRGEAVEGAEAAVAIFEQIEDPYAEEVRRQLAEWKGSG